MLVYQTKEIIKFLLFKIHKHGCYDVGLKCSSMHSRNTETKEKRKKKHFGHIDTFINKTKAQLRQNN